MCVLLPVIKDHASDSRNHRSRCRSTRRSQCGSTVSLSSFLLRSRWCVLVFGRFPSLTLFAGHLLLCHVPDALVGLDRRTSRRHHHVPLRRYRLRCQPRARVLSCEPQADDPFPGLASLPIRSSFLRCSAPLSFLETLRQTVSVPSVLDVSSELTSPKMQCTSRCEDRVSPPFSQLANVAFKLRLQHRPSGEGIDQGSQAWTCVRFGQTTFARRLTSSWSRVHQASTQGEFLRPNGRNDRRIHPPAHHHEVSSPLSDSGVRADPLPQVNHQRSTRDSSLRLGNQHLEWPAGSVVQQSGHRLGRTRQGSSSSPRSRSVADWRFFQSMYGPGRPYFIIPISIVYAEQAWWSGTELIVPFLAGSASSSPFPSGSSTSSTHTFMPIK